MVMDSRLGQASQDTKAPGGGAALSRLTGSGWSGESCPAPLGIPKIG
jgi:hypothetical protein